MTCSFRILIVVVVVTKQIKLALNLNRILVIMNSTCRGETCVTLVIESIIIMMMITYTFYYVFYYVNGEAAYSKGFKKSTI